MYSRKLKRLPVVNAAGQLAGIITRTDILDVFLKDPRRFTVTHDPFLRKLR
jgi:CBS domain-containing protein